MRHGEPLTRLFASDASLRKQNRQGQGKNPLFPWPAIPIEKGFWLCYTLAMKQLSTALLCVLLFLSLSGSALSYILPAEQILTFMIKHVGSARSFEIRHRAIVYGSDLEGGMQELDEVLYYRHPDRFRSEVNSLDGQQVRVVGPDGAIVVTNGRIISEAEIPFDHFKDVLLYRKEDEVMRRLAELEIDLNTVSLGRFKDKIAYVIGAKYPDESLPQVWIEKDTFRPIRYIVRGPGLMSATLEEIEYTDYTPLDKKRWYPGRILFYQNGELTKMYVLKTFRINPDMPDELFDIPHLKTLYEPVASVEQSPPPKSELDEVKETIRDFSRTFE